MEQRHSAPQVLVAAGSNLPNGGILPLDMVRDARFSLERRGWRPVLASRIYRNPAWPPGSGAPDYFNAVFQVVGERTPADLLADLHEIEAEAGRRRGARYISRTLDLDLIAWGDLVLPDADTVRGWIGSDAAAREAAPAELILPHPRLQDRAFVLAPLAEIAPDWRHPLLGRTAVELLSDLPEKEIAQLKPV